MAVLKVCSARNKQELDPLLNELQMIFLSYLMSSDSK